MEKQIDAVVSSSRLLLIADQMVCNCGKTTRKQKENRDISEYGAMLVKKYHDAKFNKYQIYELLSCITVHDILNCITITKVEEKLGSKIADLVFRVTEFDDETDPMRAYEISMRDYDEIFVKLIIRISCSYVALSGMDSDKFKCYIKQYPELRRKTLKIRKEAPIRNLMDYESELIKFGRRRFEGKPANSYSYKHMEFK